MDRWRWKAIYKDGTTISEKDINPETGRQWSSDHLDQSQLHALVMVPKREGLSQIVMQISPGDTMTRKWRHYKAANGGGDLGTCHVLSLSKNGTAFYSFFRPNGKIIISFDLNASERHSENPIHLDIRRGATGEANTIELENGTTCHVFKLTKNGESYYNFFMPDKTIIISTDPEGYKFSV